MNGIILKKKWFQKILLCFYNKIDLISKFQILADKILFLTEAKYTLTAKQYTVGHKNCYTAHMKIYTRRRSYDMKLVSFSTHT